MNFPEIYTLVLILASIIGGIINIFQLISFLKQSKSRFLRSRNPPLIISFAIISIISAFITSPLDFYLNIFDHRVFFNVFAVEFVHELCTVCLYVIIVCRLCLLYYDYKFNEASANQIWRDLVNPNDNNFWLIHRKTFGNLQFMTCVALIIVSLSLVILLFISSFVLKHENSHLFHFFTVIGLGFPFVAFIFYLVSFKIAEINDIYFIYSEMKYLSFCMVARIICFLIDEYFLNQYDKYLLFYSIEMLTNFVAVYIQCNWVINQLKKQDDAMSVAAEFEEKTKAKANIRHLEMIDLFNEKLSFEQFIRHCTNQLSVESVLFLVEIAQFKASLNRYNVGIQSIVYRQIDVIKANLVSFIWKERQNKQNKKLIIHAVHVGDNINENIPPLSPSPLSPKSTPISKSRSPSPPSWAPFNITTLKKANSNTTTNNLAQIATVKQENVYKEFQDNILSKTWLPIAMPLLSSNQFDEDYDSEYTKTRSSKTRTKTETKTVTKSGNSTLRCHGKSISGTSKNSKSGMVNSMGTRTKSEMSKSGDSSQRRRKSGKKKKFPKLSHDIDDSLSTSKLSENNFISPISLAIIDSNANRTNTLNEEEKKENAHAFNIKYKTDKNKNRHKKRLGLSIDIHWMYEYSRHLFLKYVDREADLSINVSHFVRKPLWDVFSKEFSDEAFQKIMLTHHKALNKLHLSPNEEIILIETYLYHAFDIAFVAVWKLLKRDTFCRFQKTKQYQILCKDINAKKLQGQRDQNERVYSMSIRNDEIY